MDIGEGQMRRKPNLVFIFTDQQRFDTLACYGNRQIRTPNLNALASESFVFENAYVTQSVCTPSRSSIMTGLYPHTNGCTRNNVPLRPEVPTLAEMVSDDYLCAYYGKWHLGDEVVAQHGFATWVSIEDYYRRFYSKEEYLSLFSSYHHFLLGCGFEPDYESVGARVFDRVKTALLPERYTKASFLGHEAARFISENRERPFVLYVGFLEPHTPYVGPLGDLYPPQSLSVAPHYRQKPEEGAALVNRMLADQYMSQGVMYEQDLTTEAGCRHTKAQYYGNVTLVDRAVGEILQALDRAGLSDDTLVVYTSDHGDMMGDHGLFEKCVLYEEAVKVPLIVRVPWQGKPPRPVSGRISQIDLVPTLLDLLGEPLPERLEGECRAAVFSGGGARGTITSLRQNDVFIEWQGPNGRPTRSFGRGPSDLKEPLESAAQPGDEWEQVRGPWRSVVSAGGWKLNLSTTDHCELYDLNTDPGETRNLFDDPAQQGRIRDLADRIRQWQARTADTVELPRL
jgi:arylsulfatase A-like enzyme